MWGRRDGSLPAPRPECGGRLRGGGVALGIFNWSDRPVQRTFALAQLGPDPARRYRVRDLWNPEAGGAATGSYTVELPPRSAALLRLGP